MKYKITIKKVAAEGSKRTYEQLDTIFSQRLEYLDIKKVVTFLNCQDSKEDMETAEGENETLSN